MVWASALHAEGRGFESRAGTFPDFFCRGVGVFAVRESIILSEFNCGILGWKAVHFVFINIFSRPLCRAIDLQCVYMFLYRCMVPFILIYKKIAF